MEVNLGTLEKTCSSCVTYTLWRFCALEKERNLQHYTKHCVVVCKAVSETATSATATARSACLPVLKNRQTRAI